MRLLLLFTVFAATLSVSERAEAILTLQFTGNGVNLTLADGDALDTDLDADEISIDLAAAPGWSGGTSFLVTADNAGSDGGSGRLNVSASYDFTGGGLVAPIRVSAADLFTVHGAPIDFVRHRVTHTVTASNNPTSNALSDSRSFWSTSLKNGPGPLDPFDFVNPGSYPGMIEVPGLSAFPPTDITIEETAGLGSLGEQLRVATTFQLVLSDGDIGVLSSSTIVNPEPTSLLLSGLGAAMFGFGYRRRKQAEAAESTC